MKVLGIDPGLDGALALYEGGNVVSILAIPAIKSTGRGREVAWDVLVFNWTAMFPKIDHVFIEKQGVRPGTGASAYFKAGVVYGGLIGIIVSRRLPYTLVTPTVWKKHYSLPAAKEAAVIRASQLFPTNAGSFYGPKGGLRDGNAEAALIAYYGYAKLEGR